MTASLNALKSAKEKLAVIVALFSIVAWTSPAAMTAHAQTLGQENSLVFEVKTQTPNDNLIKKDQLLRDYLQKKGSPLADYTGILLAQQDWKTILAISNAESTLGKHCYYNNCSGIYGRYDRGYAGLKRYETMADWIVDLQSLLDKRYEGMSLKQMNGIYVYPKSSSWLQATTSVYNDLTEIENQIDAVQNS